jgi:hypothetical protein
MAMLGNTAAGMVMASDPAGYLGDGYPSVPCSMCNSITRLV